ncbi:hypothetical protein ABDD95_14190 [Mucilaginibacter sp. PAMB04274]
MAASTTQTPPINIGILGAQLLPLVSVTSGAGTVNRVGVSSVKKVATYY